MNWKAYLHPDIIYHEAPINSNISKLILEKFQYLSRVMGDKNIWFGLFNTIPSGELVRLNPNLLWHKH